MRRKTGIRIASVLLVVHGLIEIAGLLLINYFPHALISFGGLTGSLLDQNTQTVAMFGLVWGIARLIAAWGMWSLQKWALSLGIALSLITAIAAISIVPAGVTDTFLAIPVLILLLYAWFGNEKMETL